MATYKEASWKDKIDPAFNELIKSYLKYLGHIKLPAGDGYICPDEKTLKLLERNGYPSLDGQYDLDFRMVTKAIPNLIKLGMSKKISATAKAVWRDIKELEKYVSNMVKQLPDGESKDYYKERFLLNKSKEELEQIKGQPIAELNELRKDILNDVSTLICHIWFKDMHRNHLSSTNPAINDLGLHKVSLSTTFNTLSMLVHKKPMKKLLEEARLGNDESLVKAIQIDRTLFSVEFVRTRINKAQYTGDHFFFERLASSLKKSPLQNDVEYDEVLLVLMFFWKMGLYRLTIFEMMELLESAGLKLQGDEGSFRKFIAPYKKEGALTDE